MFSKFSLQNLFNSTREVVVRQQQTRNDTRRGDARDEQSEEMLNWAFLGFEVVKFTISIGIMYYATSEGLRIISKALADPSKDSNALNEKKSLAKRLKRPEIEAMSFDQYELKLMDSVVGEDELDVTFSDIGGLETELEEVHDNVVLPVKLWKLNRVATGGQPQKLICPLPTGIMLYGLPGTGKSLIGKAIAKECEATFINIKASSILDKFVGESDKLAAALFRLGRKLGPSIIFIDEIETLLRKRDSDSLSTNSVTQTLQGVFLSEWDGLSVDRQDNAEKTGKASSDQPPVVILGATNRPLDIDAAFLRRMPVQIQTKVPNTQDRVAILKALLKKEQKSSAEAAGTTTTTTTTLVSSQLTEAQLHQVAEETEGCTGSDLRELVRVAVLQREKARLQAAKKALESGNYATENAGHHHDVPPLTWNHFLFALNKHHQSALKTATFNAKIQEEADQKSLRLIRAIAKERMASAGPSTATDDEGGEEDEFSSMPSIGEVDN